MINLEMIKKEVYKNEKRKLYIRMFFFNIIILGFLMITLSNTQSTIKTKPGINKNQYTNKQIESEKDSIKSIPCILPVSLVDYVTISDKYGYRKHPILKRWIFHQGIDILAKKRTDIFSTSDGIVEKIYREKGGYGNRIVINHGNGFKTVYAHLNNILVNENQKVKKFSKIGYVGSTGLSTNNHLHYEVLINNIPVDPLKYTSIGQ